MTYETITWESGDGVGRLTLNRPEQRNGITGVMMRELLDATRAAAEDESLRVVVLTGAGRSFCVGADLKHYSYVIAESQRHLEISSSADTDEAFKAFVDKRTPVFEGR